jgi:hypothetical protein
MSRPFVLLVALSVFIASSAAAQSTSQMPDTSKLVGRSDVVLQSAVGSVLGGFVGIIAAIPAACGQYIRTDHCRVATMAVGFGTGTLLGTVAGAVHAVNRGPCPWGEKVFRAVAGTAGGFLVTLPIVAATHGFVRIGVSPVVPLAGAIGATLTLGHCIS